MLTCRQPGHLINILHYQTTSLAFSANLINGLEIKGSFRGDVIFQGIFHGGAKLKFSKKMRQSLVERRVELFSWWQ